MSKSLTRSQKGTAGGFGNENQVEQAERGSSSSSSNVTVRDEAVARRTRWELATQHQPIYFEAKDPMTAILYLKLCEYDRWAVEDSKEAVNALHKIHLFIDEVVQKFSLYKIETRAGEFVISCQAKKNRTDYVKKIDTLVMEFASTLIEKIKYIENPSNRRLGMKIKIAVSCGQVYGAILGRSGVRYGMYGEADTIAQMLLAHVPENQIVVSDAFYEKYVRDGHDWLKKDRIQIFPDEMGKKSIYITPYVYIGNNNNRQVMENPITSQSNISDPNSSASSTIIPEGNI